MRSAAANARIVACLRAVAHPVRLQMLQLLAAAKAPVCVCDITTRFRLTQPTISHHLKILRGAGLVSTSRRGIWAHYQVRPAGIEILRRGVDDLASGPAAEEEADHPSCGQDCEEGHLPHGEGQSPGGAPGRRSPAPARRHGGLPPPDKHGKDSDP